MKDTLPKGCRRKIGRAMQDYAMLAHGDRVLVAVSGGVDSLVLAQVLKGWRHRAPISYRLEGVHIDMEPGENVPGQAARRVRQLLEQLDIPCRLLPAAWSPPARAPEGAAKKDVCFQCARSRRTQLFAHAREHGFNILALGHHRGDIIETFFLNLLQAGNLSTMVPRQDLFSGRLSLIRPLAYLDKEEIRSVARAHGLDPVRTCCPLSENTRRRDVHELLELIGERFPDAERHIFAALGNVRPDYLLSPGSFRLRHADPS